MYQYSREPIFTLASTDRKEKILRDLLIELLII